MKKVINILIGLILINAIHAQSNFNYIENELILKFKTSFNHTDPFVRDGFNNKGLDSLNEVYQVDEIQLIGNKKLRNTYLLKFLSNLDVPILIEDYYKTGLFEYVEPSYTGFGGGQGSTVETTPNDTYYNRQWYLTNDGSFSLSSAKVDADIDMDLAWDITQGSTDIVVAILDTGVKLDHPEFNNRIWENSNEINNDLDSDQNGFIDDKRGWDFVNNDNNPSDDHGHGTNVTGIIGANSNNSFGYAGVDWNCKLMICKIINSDNFGQYTWWADAIYYAVDNGANIINMSVGGKGYSNLLLEAVNYAYDNGVTIIACMMNFDNQITYYPAGFKNTIAVGATDSEDQRVSPFFWDITSGSNYGNHIDVVAPGNYIYGLHNNSNTNFNSYWGGTSQATPLVTGIASLLLSQDRSRTPNVLKEIITSTAVDQVGNSTEDKLGFDIYYGNGRVNAYQALLQNQMTSTKSESEKFKIKIYPNPTSNKLIIKGDFQNKAFTICNLFGIEFYTSTFPITSEYLEIDVEDYISGIYLVKIRDTVNKKSEIKKLIIN